MRVLALDTTTRGGSVALVENDRVMAEHGGDVTRSHAERLPLDLLRLLDAAGVPLSAIDVFACASGPGSFTGLRIGIATIQGLAFVTRRRVAAISALEALAHGVSRELGAGSLVAAWIDAHRREVFSALYRVVDAPLFSAARLVEIDPPSVARPGETLERWRAQFGVPSVVAGDAAVAYAAETPATARIVGPPLLGGPIGLLAVERARRGDTVDPAGVQPLYVRRPDAEMAREREARG